MHAYHYACLRAAQWPTRDEASAFDTHVLACILATGLDEAESHSIPITEAVGLPAGSLVDILTRWFPLMPRSAFALDEAPDPVLEMEEELLRGLLFDHRASPAHLPTWLAGMIARRAMREDHLWQDLGLFDRAELGRLLETHFPGLHAGNTRNMRWKKYFYRRLCEAEGFALCTAPSCAVCSDFQACFGDEDGMSRIAAVRRESLATA